MTLVPTRFHKSGTNVYPVNFDETQLLSEVPAGVYSVGFNMMQGFYLKLKAEQFDVPANLFGSLPSRVDRLMRRYVANEEVNALLTGEKGSGKTLLAQVFGNQAIGMGKPVILVDEAFESISGLKNFLYQLGNCVFIFDEYKKTFGEKQAEMLDFFSGANYKKRATFVIENNEWEVNEFMLKRPGRLRFHFSYGKLESLVVQQVCESLEVKPHVTEFIMAYAARVNTLGMDTLNRIIEECKFEGDAIQSVTDFNSLVADMNVPYYLSTHLTPVAVTVGDATFEPDLLDITLAGDHARVYIPADASHPVSAAIAHTDWFKECVADNELQDADDQDEFFRLDIRSAKFKMDGKKVFHSKATDLAVVGVTKEEAVTNAHTRWF